MSINRVVQLQKNLFKQIFPVVLRLSKKYKFIARNKGLLKRSLKPINRYTSFFPLKGLPTSFASIVRSYTDMSDCDKFKFRRAEEKDMQCVIDMIKDLAKVENMEDSCKLTAADLIRDSSKDFCHVYVMEDLSEANTLAGYAICFFTYSTWEGRAYFLEDLYMRPSYRGRGIGELLFREVAAKAHEFGCKRLEFHVLEWNPARRFYNRLGCVDLTETETWHYYRLKEPQLTKMAESLKKSRE